MYVAVRSSGLEHRGGILRTAGTPPDALDPAFAYSFDAWSTLAMTNDGLVGFRRVGGIEGVQLVPDLATSLPSPSDGGRTYTFQLRRGIRYSSGRLLQPEDIRAAIERVFAAAPPSPGRQFFGGIVGTDRCRSGRPCNLSSGIVADRGARTVTFRLEAPDGDFLSKLALPFAYAVPPGTAARPLAPPAIPATGPYMVASYRANRSLRLVRNPKFRQWSADAQPDGYPDEITRTFRQKGLDSMPFVRDVQHGRTDVAPALVSPPLSKQQLSALAIRSPSQLRVSTTAATEYFFLNTRVTPFDDVRVRRAVNYAFDRSAYVRLLGLGFAPSCQILPPNFPGYRHTCPYGIGGASGLEIGRRLIRNAGKTGAAVTVWVPAPRVAEGRFMVSLLDSLGLRGHVKPVAPGPTGSGYFAPISNPKTRAQMGYYGWLADFPSDVGFLPPEFSCAAFANGDPQLNQDPSGLCDPTVDRLLAEATAAQASNPAAAPALWQKAERAILALAPIVPTDNSQNVAFLAKRVGNFQYHPQWGVLLDQLWVR